MIIWLAILSGFTASLLVAVGVLLYMATKSTTPAAIAAEIASQRLVIAEITDRIEALTRREKTLAARQSKERMPVTAPPADDGLTPKQRLRAQLQGRLPLTRGVQDA